MSKTEETPLTLVRVYARSDRGRWRAGLHWPHDWVEAEVTDEQLALLEGDDQLVVHRPELRNESLPLVTSVQPGVNRPPPPRPWKNQGLERLRQEALRLDEEAKEMAVEVRGELNTRDEEADSPTVEHINPSKKRR